LIKNYIIHTLTKQQEQTKMATLTISEINSALIGGKFTNDELTSVIDAIKYARSRLGAQVKRSLTKGATVKFTSSRTGLATKGTVEKVAIKYVTVRTVTGLWRVPANMLEVV
jgi:hypothetical protein